MKESGCGVEERGADVIEEGEKDGGEKSKEGRGRGRRS